nr:zinc finger, CCHC-type [Tanacetum cinerariifolium]
MEDPELFTLPCRLGDSKPFDTLADLGSCVNIIPFYLFKKLKIGLLEETDHIFGLTDGTKSYLVRIVKDIEVHIGKLKLLNDFYAVYIKKNPKTPFLVGRGFLATANTVIDCRMAKITAGEGITRSVFEVKGVDLGEDEPPYWNTLGKRESYKPRPRLDEVVSLILVSLNKDFDNFVQNYNMHGMGKTVNELHAMLKLHEETLPKKDANPALHAIRAGRVQKNQKNKSRKAVKGSHGKGKGKMGNASNNASKPNTPPPPKKDNPAKDAICHQCGEVGHWRRNCPVYLAELMKKKKLSQGDSTSGSTGKGVISVSRLFDDGFVNRFDDDNVISVSKNNLVYFKAIPRDGIYEIDMSCSNTNDSS